MTLILPTTLGEATKSGRALPLTVLTAPHGPDRSIGSIGVGCPPGGVGYAWPPTWRTPFGSVGVEFGCTIGLIALGLTVLMVSSLGIVLIENQPQLVLDHLHCNRLLFCSHLPAP